MNHAEAHLPVAETGFWSDGSCVLGMFALRILLQFGFFSAVDRDSEGQKRHLWTIY